MSIKIIIKTIIKAHQNTHQLSMAKTSKSYASAPKSRDNQHKFERGETAGNKSQYRRTKDKKLKTNLKRIDDQYKDAVSSAAATEYLLPESQGYLEAEDEMEKTFKFKPVSYTHLDVYKRQTTNSRCRKLQNITRSRMIRCSSTEPNAVWHWANTRNYPVKLDWVIFLMLMWTSCLPKTCQN